MTTTAHAVLAAFADLSPSEQHQVAAEILRRSANTDEMPEGALEELAAELFRRYDAEEAARAKP
jgi:hypothetical protein